MLASTFSDMKSSVHIKDQSLKQLASICIVLYIFIFHVIDHIPAMRYIQDACLQSCTHDLCTSNLPYLRGKNYYLHTLDKGFEVNKCLVTTWELSHLLFHAYIGYNYNLQISLTLSIVFEIFEQVVYDCGSFLDLAWNLMGFFIGYMFRGSRLGEQALPLFLRNLRSLEYPC